MTDQRTPPPSDAPDDRLDAVRRRRAAITPGEWDFYPNMAGNRHWSDITAENGLVLAEVQNHRHREDGMIEITSVNADFIAHAPADIDYLLDALTEARSAQAAAEHRLADHRDATLAIVDGLRYGDLNASEVEILLEIRQRLIASWDGDGSDSE